MYRRLSVLLLLAACASEPMPDPPTPEVEQVEAVPDKAAKAAAIAVALAAAPQDAERILKEHSVTEAELETMLYEIAADPALSSAYEAARR